MPEFRVQIPYMYDAREYQIPFWQMARLKKFIYLVWSRRHGKDMTCWNYAIDQASRQVMDVTYIFPTSEMGKNNLWEAKTNDGIPFTDFIPMELRKRRHRNDDGLNDSTKQVELINGSIIRIVSGERPGRLRGGNSKLYIISEWAECDPQILEIIIPVVEANGGQIILNTTPKGSNHAKSSWESWVEDPMWWCSKITAADTNVFNPDQLLRLKLNIIKRFRLMGRSEIEATSFFEQEYMCNFDSPIIGAYYGDAMTKAKEQGRIGNVPYEESLLVHTWWDLGIDDSMTIWFMQFAGREIRLIDYVENNGEGLPWYVHELQKRKYNYGTHIWPHDGIVRELATGKSRQDSARALGLNVKIAPKLGVDDGINQVRMMLGRCWFDAEKCERGIDALINYHKTYDEKNMVFKAEAKHDWSSHGADGFRTGAIGMKEDLGNGYSEIIDDDIPDYARTTGGVAAAMNQRVGNRNHLAGGFTQ